MLGWGGGVLEAAGEGHCVGGGEVDEILRFAQDDEGGRGGRAKECPTRFALGMTADFRDPD